MEQVVLCDNCPCLSKEKGKAVCNLGYAASQRWFDNLQRWQLSSKNCQLIEVKTRKETFTPRTMNMV